MVARLVRDQEVACSSHVTSTNTGTGIKPVLCVIPDAIARDLLQPLTKKKGLPKRSRSKIFREEEGMAKPSCPLRLRKVLGRAAYARRRDQEVACSSLPSQPTQGTGIKPVLCVIPDAIASDLLQSLTKNKGLPKRSRSKIFREEEGMAKPSCPLRLRKGLGRAAYARRRDQEVACSSLPPQPTQGTGIKPVPCVILS